MKRSTRLNRLFLTAIVATAAALSAIQLAQAHPPDPAVPARIQPDAGNKVFLIGHATGVQIYSCGAAATGFAWALVGPRADLYDDNGHRILTHFAGPTWKAKDGSTVVGAVVDRVTVDPTAVAWLLLSATPATGPDGGDRLAETTFVQRIATTGGLAPAATECTAATAGATAEVPYTADYYFWKKKANAA